MSARVNLYDFVGEQEGGEGLRSSDFYAQLAAIAGDVEIHIDSKGGAVTDGFAMANLLMSREGKTTVVVDGICASAATFVAAAADLVRMHEASLLMVHGPWATLKGNASQLREHADTLDKLSEGMRSLYRRRGIKDELITKWLDSEATYFLPEEALAVGLCDEVIRQPKVNVAQARAKLFSKLQAKGKKAMTPEEEKEKAKADAKAKVKAAKAEYAAQFGEEMSTTDQHQAKVKANAEEDPEVKQAKALLLDAKSKYEVSEATLMDRIKALETKEANAKLEEDFSAEAVGKLSKADATTLLRSYSHDITKARATLELMPKASLGASFKGGSPVGGSAMSAIPGENTKISQTGKMKIYQHGVQWQAMAEEIAKKGDPKVPYSARLLEAQREVARKHPHLVDVEAAE